VTFDDDEASANGTRCLVEDDGPTDERRTRLAKVVKPGE